MPPAGVATAGFAALVRLSASVALFVLSAIRSCFRMAASSIKGASRRSYAPDHTLHALKALSLLGSSALQPPAARLLRSSMISPVSGMMISPVLVHSLPCRGSDDDEPLLRM